MKLGYYPVFDMLLGIRELYALERYTPFPNALESIQNRLSNDDKELILKIGDKTHGWLNIIEIIVELVALGISNTEETLIHLNKNINLFKETKLEDKEKVLIGPFLMNLWQNYFSKEIARYSKATFESTICISNTLDNEKIVDYLQHVSDRTIKINDNTLKLLIKPERIVDFSKIENIIITPSIFASRKLMFWDKASDYVFYISIDSRNESNMDPSDMLLIKLLALNDKTRLKMLKLLVNGNYNTMEMAQFLNLNASTVSRHFKVFKDAGFVDIFNQEGNIVYYSINIKEIKNTMDIILNYIKK